MDNDTTSARDLETPQGYTRSHGHGGESSEPDVLLDVPQLRVEEIILDVEDLRAHVSVQAEVLNLLRLSVGADVELGGVHLEIRGVEAQVLLKARLDKVAEIINRVLSTVDRNPEIIEQILPPLAATTDHLERTVGRSAGELADAVGTTPPDAGPSAAETLAETGVSDVAEAPESEDAPVEADEGRSRGLMRRRKQERKTEEPPP